MNWSLNLQRNTPLVLGLGLAIGIAVGAAAQAAVHRQPPKPAKPANPNVASDTRRELDGLREDVRNGRR